MAESEKVRTFLHDCYAPLKLRGRSVHAVRLHTNTLNNMAKFLGREATWADFNSETVSKFLCWLKSRGRASATANDNLCRIMALSRFGVKKRKLEEEPDVLPEIEPERAPRAWLPEQMDTLIQACGRQKGLIEGVPASLWWTTLHLVCLFTGERIAAILSLRWEQVELETGWILIDAEQRKGKRRDKEWQLPEVVVDQLRRLRKYSKSDLVFAHGHHWTTVYNWYKKLLKDAGLPTDRKSKFHRIRKSSASYFAAAGGNATELLDHSSTNITKKYLDPRIVKQPSAADLIRMRSGRKNGRTKPASH